MGGFDRELGGTGPRDNLPPGATGPRDHFPSGVTVALMGIVNVTPDSFSDGGRYVHTDSAVMHAHRLVAEGADILDVGGESTRPGAEPVPGGEELERVIPVIEGLAGVDAQVSVDTTKADVARAALAAGATYVNDVSALRHDPAMAGVVAAAGADCCLMHMLGNPRSMQHAPRYVDVVSDVKSFLEQRLAFAVSEGIPEDSIQLDPGIGFGKTLEHNIELLRRLDELVALGRPVVVGVSRKGFIGTLTGRTVASDRVAGTVAANVVALAGGARIFRVHDVAAVRDGLAVAAATLPATWPQTTTSRSTTTTS